MVNPVHTFSNLFLFFSVLVFLLWPVDFRSRRPYRRFSYAFDRSVSDEPTRTIFKNGWSRQPHRQGAAELSCEIYREHGRTRHRLDTLQTSSPKTGQLEPSHKTCSENTNSVKFSVSPPGYFLFNYFLQYS